MKKIIIVLIAIFQGGIVFSQNPCDAKLADTLPENLYGNFFLKDFSWSEDAQNDSKKEFAFMLRKNTKYGLKIGNSKFSETPVQCEVIFSKTTKSRGEEVEIEVTNEDGNDTTIRVKPVTHLETGKTFRITKVRVAPDEVTHFEFVVPETTKYKVKLTNLDRGYVCNHMVLYFVKKVSDI